MPSWIRIVGRLAWLTLAVLTVTIVWTTIRPASTRAVIERTGEAHPTGPPGSGPRLSPHETVERLTKSGTISIEYGRPFKRGRQIWGGLVPWRRWWMPGADEATLLRIDRGVTLGDLPLQAGEYSLYMWVDTEKPQLIVNRQVGQWHNTYDSSQDVGRVDLIRSDLRSVAEQLTFAITDNGYEETLTLEWDQIRYSVRLVFGGPSSDPQMAVARSLQMDRSNLAIRWAHHPTHSVTYLRFVGSDELPR